MLSERSLIETILAPLTKAGSGALGLTDDAAFIRPRPGHDLVITQDSLQAGVHFFADDPLEQVAQKALRVNLSDLYAKGAVPTHYLLSLFIPQGMGEDDLKAFARGLAQDQQTYDITLLGGDTVRSSAVFGLTVTMSGEVPQGRMIHRSGAKAGDVLYVSGTIGDAALGLKILNKEIEVSTGSDANCLTGRYRLPQPPTTLGPALLAHANAAMDVSDGLAGDLNLICKASSLTAVIEADAVPLSGPAQELVEARPELLTAVLTGGDDYQVLCAVPPGAAAAFEAAAGGRVTPIGVMQAGEGPPRFVGKDGQNIALKQLSYTHF